MTKLKGVYICLLVGAAIFYVIYIDRLAFAALLFGLLLPIPLFIQLFAAVRNVSVDIINKNIVESRGNGLHLLISVKNPSALPVANIEAELHYTNAFSGITEKAFIVLPVCPHSDEVTEIVLKSDYCGKINILLKKVRFYDFIGLTHITRKVNINAAAVILPDGGLEAVIAKRNDISIDTDVFSDYKSGDDPSEVFNLREYVPGDKINRIHWKLSSKYSSGFIVKDYSLPISSSVLILTEFFADKSGDRYLEIVDTLIDCTYTLSLFLSENKMEHEIGFYNTTGSTYVKEKVTNKDELAIVLGKIYDCKPYILRTFALDYSFKADSMSRYAHIIYITSTISEKIVMELSDSHRAPHVTIIYIISGENTAVPEYSAENVTIIPVKYNDVSKSLSGMEV